ncbi:hypothetical protein [Streptomyces sp. NPDC016845]|uniref:hypothetical protein n=1 Tax=Streptomyces sp. NPDC016845 TaxID=3364972 RepID=UPI00378B2653
MSPMSPTNAVSPTNARAGRIDVEIGELVLDGFGHVDRDRMAEAFRRELSRLVREHGLPLADAVGHTEDAALALDVVSGLPPLPHTVSSTRLGAALARSVHAGLTTGRGGRPEPGRP